MSSSDSILIIKYNELVTSVLNKLYKLVIVESTSDELIDIPKTQTKMFYLLSDPLQRNVIMNEYRPALIGFLNAVYFSRSEISTEWWWEMEYRLRKMITVSTVLERENLISMGGTPDITDIPQCLVGLWNLIEKKRTNIIFDQLKITFISEVKKARKTKNPFDYYLASQNN